MWGGGVVNVNSHTDWATENQNQTKNSINQKISTRPWVRQNFLSSDAKSSSDQKISLSH